MLSGFKDKPSFEMLKRMNLTGRFQRLRIGD